ncbi:MAG: hypothetical protein IJD48_02210, partial [Clostridia bacterium]|nr:hypothetical protein [Clostridia bacterium]
MLKKALKSQIIFKSNNDYIKITQPLKNSGIDFYKPIYKLECYKKFDIVKIFLKLNQFKNLADKGLMFNLFVFVDDYKNLQTIIKIVNKIKFNKMCDVRVYHCMDINFDLLCGINYLNLIDENTTKINNSKMGQLKQETIDIVDDFSINSSI